MPPEQPADARIEENAYIKLMIDLEAQHQEQVIEVGKKRIRQLLDAGRTADE